MKSKRLLESFFFNNLCRCVIGAALDTTQPIHPTSNPTFKDVTLTDLSANTFVATDASKKLVSQSVSGTANQVIVSGTPGGGAVTLSAPQDVATTSSPTFLNVTANNTVTAKGGGLGLPAVMDSESLVTSGAFSISAANGASVSGGVANLNLYGNTGITLQSNSGAIGMIASGIGTSQPLQIDGSSRVYSGPIALAPANVSGTLPVSLGGTNSSNALANGALMVSTGGAIREGTSSSTPWRRKWHAHNQRRWKHPD